ncbi:GTP-binding protein gtr2 [Saxophila tyrrhenica]|uniref:GTP-binding protein gtr2 n=1 Tax=Saxophila tyrrhenica TaxID=1690608 RepID=A0AAV9NY71_9PEZI|nr:GTP-binding protein gtr2 [Saxophila tyrrhenica]
MAPSIRCTTALSLLTMQATIATSETFSFSSPNKVPKGASGIVPKDFASYSWPGHWFTDFAGNATYPNLFSKDILDLLASKTGAQPFVRIGGTSTDRIWYNASQQVASRNVFENTGSLTSNIGIPDRVEIGPAFFEGFRNFPDTSFSWQMNMGNTYGTPGGLENALEVARHVMHTVGGRLDSFEIGNEPDIFYLVGHRPKNYTLADYVRQWNEYADACSSQVLKGNPYGLAETRFFQGLTTASGEQEWSADNVLNSGLDKHNHLKSMSMHHYDSNGEPWVRLQNSFMNHTNIAANVSLYDDDIAASHNYKPSLPFILGETNSDSSNLNMSQFIGVFGSALWTIDRTFLSMAANMQRQNFIQGTTFGYTQWVPVPLEGRQPYTRPPLYGYIFAADALGRHPKAQVYPIPTSVWNLSAYGIYQAGKLAKYAVINLDEYNSTASYARPEQRVRLTVPKHVRHVGIERLTAAGADADEGVQWAGLSWNYTDGRLAQSGKHKVERVQARRGVVNLQIPSTQAVLVALDGCQD